MNSIGNTYSYAQSTQIGVISGKTGSPRSLGPKIDFGLDVFANPDIQQFVFRTELAFSVLTGKFNIAATANTTPIALDYTQNSWTIIPQFLFNVYNKDKLKVYIDGGFGLNFSHYSNNMADGYGRPTAIRLIPGCIYPFKQV